VRAGKKPTICQEDVLDMAGFLFGVYEFEAQREGIVKLATALLLPELHDSGNSEAGENLVRIAIEAHAG